MITIEDVDRAFQSWLVASNYAQALSRVLPKEDSVVVAAWQRELTTFDRYLETNNAFQLQKEATDVNTAQNHD